MKASRDISRLVEIMAALRTPVTGCPWDLVQNFASIGPYTIEEAYEVVDAIQRGDMEDLRDELGDLLLQVVFHARMAEEQGAFDLGGVVEAITTKLLRRHPHVFGDAQSLAPQQVKKLWGAIKADEKREKRARRIAAGQADEAPLRLLDSVPVALPALTRALKLQQHAAVVGFDWNDTRQVLAKIREETDEIEAALDAADAGRGARAAVVAETGDLIFAAVNLLRHLDADPELTLRRANSKFATRFSYIESSLHKMNKAFSAMSLVELEALWTEAKRLEPRPPAAQD